MELTNLKQLNEFKRRMLEIVHDRRDRLNQQQKGPQANGTIPRMPSNLSIEAMKANWRQSLPTVTGAQSDSRSIPEPLKASRNAASFSPESPRESKDSVSPQITKMKDSVFPDPLTTVTDPASPRTTDPASPQITMRGQVSPRITKIKELVSLWTTKIKEPDSLRTANIKDPVTEPVSPRTAEVCAELVYATQKDAMSCTEVDEKLPGFAFGPSEIPGGQQVSKVSEPAATRWRKAMGFA